MTIKDQIRASQRAIENELANIYRLLGDEDDDIIGIGHTYQNMIDDIWMVYERQHHDYDYKCTKCKKSTFINTISEDEIQFKCEGCGLTTSFKRSIS